MLGISAALAVARQRRLSASRSTVKGGREQHKGIGSHRVSDEEIRKAPSSHRVSWLKTESKTGRQVPGQWIGLSRDGASITRWLDQAVSHQVQRSRDRPSKTSNTRVGRAINFGRYPRY